MLKENSLRFAEGKEDYWYARTFSGSNRMLSVFYNRQRKIMRFVYFQDLTSENKASLAWSEENGLTYTAIDSGEQSPLANHSPLTGAKMKLDRDLIWKNFEAISDNIDRDVKQFIRSRIFQHESM